MDNKEKMGFKIELTKDALGFLPDCCMVKEDTFFMALTAQEIVIFFVNGGKFTRMNRSSKPPLL